MGENFSKLRFKEFAKAAAAGAIGGALALQPVPAAAERGSIIVHAGQATWFVNTNITISTSDSEWGISSASLHTVSGTRDDAYDGALSWHVFAGAINTPDGEAGGYVSPGGVVSVLPNNPPNDPSVATTVTGTTQVIAGLNVSGQLYFSATKAVTRSILFLQNPTGAAITVNVVNADDLGSDSNTSIRATSSGDTPFTYPTDHWWVSCQQEGGVCPAAGSGLDPVLTVAISQAGAPVQATQVDGPVDGDDNPSWTFSVTVQPGGTQAVMAFSQLSDTEAHAKLDALLFNTSASLEETDYLAGLSGAQLAQIVNWNLSGVDVPTLGEWAKIGMAGLLGLAGLFSIGFFRRRQRGADAS
jgi:hypothetical protein